MEHKKIYILNIESRATLYGIGTYLHQLTTCLKRNRIAFEVITLLTKGDEVTTTIKEGVRYISIPKVEYRKEGDAIYYYRNASYLLDRYIIKDKNVECIFHFNFMVNTQFISILKKRYKCKIILVCHYTEWSFSLLGNEEELLSIMKKDFRKLTSKEKQIRNEVRDNLKMIKKCDRLICIAHHTLNTFCEILDVDPSKCVVIHNAIKDEYINHNLEQKKVFKNKYFIPENTKILLFVGRLDGIKGIYPLLESFKKCLMRQTNIHLIIAGEGDFPTWINEAADCWTKISFTGLLSSQKIRELYQIADVGIVPSLFEEFGLVAIEMMMHELPIIVADTGGLSEIVENGSSGLKIPIRTINGRRVLSQQYLADAIMLLINNEEFAAQIAKKGRNRFLQNFEIKLFEKKMLDFYKTI